MNQKTVKTGMILISYVAVLGLLVVYFKEILAGIDVFLGYASPFIIGIVIAFFLNPPYRFFMKTFSKLKLPEAISRLISTILVLVLAYGLITGIVMIVIPQVTSNFKNFFNNFDQYLSSFQMTLNTITEKFNIENFDLNVIIEFIEDMGTKVQSSILEWGPQAFTYTRKVISSITSILIGIIFSIYILNARDKLLRQTYRLAHAVFNEKVFNILHHIGSVMLRTFDNYVVGQSIEAMILGILCYIGMLSFNFAYPGLISVIVAITALVPIVGTIVGGAIGFFLYLLVDPVKAFIFLIFFAVLQQLENNLIYPKVVGSKIGLPGLWVLFAVMIGSQVGGLLGMLFGVPIFTVIYTLLKDLTIYKENLKKESLAAACEPKDNPENPSRSEFSEASETPVVSASEEPVTTVSENELAPPLFIEEDGSEVRLAQNIEKILEETETGAEDPVPATKENGTQNPVEYKNSRTDPVKPSNPLRKRPVKPPYRINRDRPQFFFGKPRNPEK